jgi:hypothetical protein
MITQTRWRKSSRSGASANGCVELAHTLNAIRDSKNPTGPTLHLDLAPLLAAAKAGALES